MRIPGITIGTLICALVCSDVAAMYYEPSIGSDRNLFIARAEKELKLLRQNSNGWRLQERWQFGTVREQLLGERDTLHLQLPPERYDQCSIKDNQYRLKFLCAEVNTFSHTIEFQVSYLFVSTPHELSAFKWPISTAPETHYMIDFHRKNGKCQSFDLHHNMFSLFLVDKDQLNNWNCFKGSLVIGTILPYRLIKIVKSFKNILDWDGILLRDGIIYVVHKNGKVIKFFVDFPPCMFQKNQTTAGCGFVLEKNSDIFFKFK